VPALLPREIASEIEAALTAVPVVVLEGGRAVGKSTVCDQLIERHRWPRRLDLADRSIAATLQLDPVRYLEAQPTPCFIDEAQLQPELTLWAKQVVDRRHGEAGQFVLTGSARLGRHALGGSDPLAGRSVRLRMWSLTRSEMVVHESDFIDRAFGGGWTAGGDTTVPLDTLWLGGLPSISGVLTTATVEQWDREVSAYVESVLPLAVAETRADLGRLLRTFRYLAANSGQLLNIARAASELSIQAVTLRRQIEMLEACFLLFRVEAHRPAEHRVVTAHPRLFATDVGLATWASRAWLSPLAATALGMLTETLVAHDLAALADAGSQRVVLRHWRDNRNQREVDLLMVHPDGRTIPIEVKASTSVGPDDTAGLRAYVDEVGPACERAILIYEGDRVVDLTPTDTQTQIVAVPRFRL
jgi:predicted AAA+ superfamily ATPase